MAYLETLTDEAKLKDVIKLMNEINAVLLRDSTRIDDARARLEKLEEYLKIKYVYKDESYPKYMKKE